MAHYVELRSPQERSTVNVRERWEMEFWTQQLGISEQQLREAISAVGTSLSSVLEYVHNGGKQ